MSKGGCENKSALFILFIFHSKKFTKFQPIIEEKQLKVGGKSHCEINAFSSSCWPQLLAPNYCNVIFPAQQLWVFSYNAWRVWRTPDKRSETIFFIQNLSRSFRFTAPWRCFFSSVHLTHFLQGSGQGTEMASRSLVLCPVTHFCVVFEVCIWIIVRLEDPNMAHYKISNRVSHLLIFYLLVFDRIHDAMCLNQCPGPPAEI